jgi:hypothetical protein
MFDRQRVLAAYQQGVARARALARASSEWWMEELELDTDRELLRQLAALFQPLRAAVKHTLRPVLPN